MGRHHSFRLVRIDPDSDASRGVSQAPLTNDGFLAPARTHSPRQQRNFGVVFDQGHSHDWLFTVGLQIPFGPPPVVAPESPPSASPAAMPPPPPPPPPATRNFELSADGTFAFAKSDLTPAGRSRIDSTLQELKSSGIRLHAISIVGHTVHGLPSRPPARRIPICAAC